MGSSESYTVFKRLTGITKGKKLTGSFRLDFLDYARNI